MWSLGVSPRHALDASTSQALAAISGRICAARHVALAVPVFPQDYLARGWSRDKAEIINGLCPRRSCEDPESERLLGNRQHQRVITERG